jgi:hypothetical protein
MSGRYVRLFFAVLVLVLVTASSSRGAGGPTIGNDQLPPDYQILEPGANESSPCQEGGGNANCPYCTAGSCGCAAALPGQSLEATCTCACNGTTPVCTRTCTYRQNP